MFKERIVIFLVLIFFAISLHGQSLNLDNYDVLIGDTLISRTDFIKNGKELDSVRLRQMKFVPISDGQKSIYYLNGLLYGQGEIKSKRENGFWTYWHENGNKAREGSFAKGKRIGTHTYWYPNGNLRGVGNFKDDEYDGAWTMYTEDGSEKVEQFYKKGVLVTKK